MLINLSFNLCCVKLHPQTQTNFPLSTTSCISSFYLLILPQPLTNANIPFPFISSNILSCLMQLSVHKNNTYCCEDGGEWAGDGGGAGRGLADRGLHLHHSGAGRWKGSRHSCGGVQRVEYLLQTVYTNPHLKGGSKHNKPSFRYRYISLLNRRRLKKEQIKIVP